MADRGVTVERRFPAPRALVWGLLADTNRYDRALGLTPPHYEWRTIDGRRARVGTARQGGMSMTWTEPPYEWVEGRWLSTRREFLSGPARRGGLEVEIDDDGEGCIARVTAWGELRSFALRLLGPLARAQLRRTLEAYMDSIASAVREHPSITQTDPDPPEIPAAVRAQALVATIDDATISGGRASVNHAELQRRAADLTHAPLDPAPARRLLDTLGQRPDEEVAQMRPFALARQWHLDRRSVLRAFLYGTQAGLVDLNWQVNCPVCRVSAQVITTLGDVGRDVHCESCNIRYDVDFGANVEAVFRCNEAIRAVQPAVYCEASPSFRPHIVAQLRLEPRATRTADLTLADGRLVLRTLGAQRPLELSDPAPPATLEIEVNDTEVTARAAGRSGDGRTRLELRSSAEDPAYLLIERGAWVTDTVLGSIVASQPEFVDLFATEAPAAGLELTVGRITLLFTDLTGSTALYERIGDARAYAIVQEHFRVMEQVIHRHDGAVIKTMGDAVMASFLTPANAVAAALEAVRETEARHRPHEVGVKLGVHEGPCLAVRANDRLDFFGTTVNLAARLQGQAGAGELVLVQSLADEPRVAEHLGHAPRRALTARLKGIREAQALVAIDLRPDAAVDRAPP